MSIEPNPEKQTHAVIEDAENQLKDINPSPLSAHAFITLKTKIAQHITELINESIKVSKRHRADTVSAAHVERASEYLVSSTSRRIYRHLGTVGGILLGASLSNILAMTLTAKYTGEGTILSAALGIAGAFMIALHIAKE